MSDLLGALGQAWPRLLAYPGGFSAVLAMLVLARIRGIRRLDPPSAARIIDLLFPLCAISLLPLPFATSFPYGLDLLTAQVLLLWPLLRQTATERQRAPCLARYLPMLLAGIVLVSATTTFDLSGWLRWPTEPVRQITVVLGIVAWIVALPRVTPPTTDVALAGSSLGLLLIGSLPLIAALNSTALGRVGLPGMTMVLAVSLSALALIGAERLPPPIASLLVGLALVSAGITAIWIAFD
ncbi:MAG: hypothetical protein K6356_10950 [Chloroflexus sp.]